MGSVKALINHAHEGKIISKNENRILLIEGKVLGKYRKITEMQSGGYSVFLSFSGSLVSASVAERGGEGVSAPLKGFTLLFPALQQKYRHLMANLGTEF